MVNNLSCYSNWSFIPKIGDNVVDADGKRYVIAKATITNRNNSYDCIFQLNENHIRRSEFVGADTSYMLYDIPNSEIVNRLTFERDIIRISMIDEIKNKNTARISSIGESAYLNVFGDTNQPKHVAIEFYNKDGSGNVYFQYIFDTMTYICAGSNLLFNIKARDNRVYGRKTAKKIYTQLYTYTSEIGECDYFKLKICKFPFTFGYDEEFDFIAENAPISSLEVNQAIHSQYITAAFSDVFYQKDAFERFNFTYQVSYIGSKQTIVRNELVKEMLTYGITSSLKVLFSNQVVGEYDKLPSIYDVRNVSLVTLGANSGLQTKYINITLASTYTGNVKSIVLYNPISGSPYLIKNYFNGYTFDSNSIRIYISFEKAS
ncbi:MAG: hypothetical protein WC006_05490 [Bacilli bacterium]|nr:hypothetical protein [Bacilli bacterium]